MALLSLAWAVIGTRLVAHFRLQDSWWDLLALCGPWISDWPTGPQAGLALRLDRPTLAE
jgi:hypothetical protein